MNFVESMPDPLSRFDKPADELEAMYGLPREVRFCRRCVISNQRPNSTVEYHHSRESRKATIRFDADGVCDACRYQDVKARIDWADRERRLRELCDRHRRTDGRYDCIVPGSGGKDSFYAAWHLKHELGMHPLTVTWAPHTKTLTERVSNGNPGWPVAPLTWTFPPIVSPTDPTKRGRSPSRLPAIRLTFEKRAAPRSALTFPLTIAPERKQSAPRGTTTLS
jgi:hypothetical protein